MASSPLFLVSEGEDFEIVQKSRVENTQPVSALKVDGTTGAVTMAGVAVSSATSTAAAVAANGTGILKATVTMTKANFTSLGAGVKSGAVAIATLPANARLVGYDLGEGAGFAAWDDSTHAAWRVSIGISTAATDTMAATSCKAGDSGFPKAGTAGVLGFSMAPQGGRALVATVDTAAAAVDINTLTAGNVTVNVFYTVLA